MKIYKSKAWTRLYNFISADIDFIAEFYLFTLYFKVLCNVKRISGRSQRDQRHHEPFYAIYIPERHIRHPGWVDSSAGPLFCPFAFLQKAGTPGLYAIKAGRARYTCAAWHCLLYPVPCDQPSCFTDREENKNHESKSLEQAEQNTRDQSCYSPGNRWFAVSLSPGPGIYKLFGTHQLDLLRPWIGKCQQVYA